MAPEREDYERFFDLDKKINESVERESERADGMYLGDLFLDSSEEEPKEEPKRRGRPKGVKESVPRKPVSKVKEIVERTKAAIGRLVVLNEVMKKQGKKKAAKRIKGKK